MKAAVRFIAIAASVAALGAWAQDDDDFDFGNDDDVTIDAGDAPSSSESEESSVDAGEDEDDPETAALKKSVNKAPDRVFYSLPLCRSIEGNAEVKKPGETEWHPIEEGKFYPHGTHFRTVGPGRSKLTIQFGTEINVVLAANSEFGTRFQPIASKERVITLQGGVLTVKLPRNMPEGVFKVAAPGFTVVNLQGESRYAYVQTSDGDATQIRCITGTLAIEGMHYRFPALRAAQEVKIRSTLDNLFTGLYGNRGDCMVVLDQGDELDHNYETGESTVIHKTLDWKLSPKTKVAIHRAVPKIGERMSVSIMTFNTNGDLKNRRAFTEGRYEINSGEIGPRDAAADEKLAKQAAEAAEASSVVVSEVEVSEEEPSSEDGDSGDSGSSGDEDDFAF